MNLIKIAKSEYSSQWLLTGVSLVFGLVGSLDAIAAIVGLFTVSVGAAIVWGLWGVYRGEFDVRKGWL